jgi:preprotein translocase subunit SecG
LFNHPLKTILKSLSLIYNEHSKNFFGGEGESMEKKSEPKGHDDSKFMTVITIIIIGLFIFYIGYNIVQNKKKEESKKQMNYSERLMYEELEHEIMKERYE